MIKKGIILAGGSGSRLYPTTQGVSKQLLPVYDKPMIYYPLTTLILGGIKEIAIISTPRDLPIYERILGNGNNWGLNFTYIEQKAPKGIAESFILAEEFIGKNSVSLILGDNLFYGNLRVGELCSQFTDGALIFGYAVKDPERYGIIEFTDKGKVIDIQEKPKIPKSRYAVPGLYLYDNNVIDYAKELAPSSRGELEITDINKLYLNEGKLNVNVIGRGINWLDAGTSDSLQESSNFIKTIEKRQSLKVGCPEEASFRMNLIDQDGLSFLISEMPDCEYKEYLANILEVNVL